MAPTQCYLQYRWVRCERLPPLTFGGPVFDLSSGAPRPSDSGVVGPDGLTVGVQDALAPRVPAREHGPHLAVAPFVVQGPRPREPAERAGRGGDHSRRGSEIAPASRASSTPWSREMPPNTQPATRSAVTIWIPSLASIEPCFARGRTASRATSARADTQTRLILVLAQRLPAMASDQTELPAAGGSSA